MKMKSNSDVSIWLLLFLTICPLDVQSRRWYRGLRKVPRVSSDEGITKFYPAMSLYLRERLVYSLPFASSFLCVHGLRWVVLWSCSPSAHLGIESLILGRSVCRAVPSALRLSVNEVSPTFSVMTVASGIHLDRWPLRRLSAGFDQVPLISCRALGRGVEEGVLFGILEYMRGCDCRHLEADFISGPRNQPIVDFLSRSGFHQTRPDRFELSVASSCLLPRHISWTGPGHSNAVSN